MNLCGPSEHMLFYFAFGLLGFMSVMFVYALYLQIDRFFGWSRVDCRKDGKGYIYEFDGVFFRSENHSISSEYVHQDIQEQNLANLDQSYCYVQRRNPHRSRLINGTARFANMSFGLLGVWLVLLANSFLLPYCFRERDTEMVLLVALGLSIGSVYVRYMRKISASSRI